jgi:uncharacterized protein YfdQ (DUF2303 family)
MAAYAPDQIGDVQAALAAGVAIGDPRQPIADPNAGVYAVLPKDCRLESLEAFLPQPLRVKQRVQMHDADSFIAYVNQYKGNATRLFFDQTRETFEAVLDYHLTASGALGAAAGWCGHTAAFTPVRSIEFMTWTEQNRKQMTQVEFARFIEENLPDVVEPAGADLLEVALTMEAKKEATFASGIRLSNGQVQFQYDEEIRGTAKKGTLDVPEQFVLGIPIHVNGPAYRIPLRLRWRLKDGKLAFWYEMVRPHRFIEDALKEMRDRIAAQVGIAILAGSPKA